MIHLAILIFLVPLLLLIFSSHFAIIGDLRIRFIAASFLSFLIITAFIFYQNISEFSNIFPFYFLLITSIIGYGILWSLLCWGFTSSLLISLYNQQKTSDFNAWFSGYGGGASIQDFYSDRLSILIKLGLVIKDGDFILETNRGRLFKIIINPLINFYRIKE